MNIEIITQNGVEVAHVVSDEVVIADLQSAVDLMMTVKYETGVKNIALSKDLVCGKFFILSSGLAGEILPVPHRYLRRLFRLYQ